MTAVLILRPNGAATAAKLARMGINPILAPAYSIVGHSGAWRSLAAKDFDAVALTSAHGLTGFKDLDPQVQETFLSLPVFCVGEKTKAAAKNCGFTNCYCGGGNGRDLADIMLAHTPKLGRVLWPSGRNIGFDLATALTRDGIMATRIITYFQETRPTHRAAIIESMGQIKPGDGVAIFARSQAEVFHEILAAMNKERQEAFTKGLTLFGISGPALAPLMGFSPLIGFSWAKICHAPSPNENDLCQLIANTG